MSHEDQDIVLEFEEFVNNQAYMKAVNKALTAGRLDPKDHFMSRLFGQDQIFLKALANAANSSGDGRAWLDNFQVPPWFFKLKEVPKEWYKKNAWYKNYRQNLFEAQIRCAKHVIDHQAGWAELAKHSPFSVGWVYELSQLLKNQFSQEELPILERLFWKK